MGQAAYTLLDSGCQQFFEVLNELAIWTIGHSTQSSGEFIATLQAFKIKTLVDVRSFPGSRRYPQFNKENLRASLHDAGIDYVHLPEIGGRRKANVNSRNVAWRNESFRGYADYMETAEFRAGIDRVTEIARTSSTAIMCAEALWWRCHRSLIADFLKARGAKVIHILGQDKSQEHPFTSAARIVRGELSYRGVLESPE